MNLQTKISFLIRSSFSFHALKERTYPSSRNLVGFKSFVHVNEISPCSVCVPGGRKTIVFQDATADHEFVSGAVAQVRDDDQRVVETDDFPYP
jgi:hypothetical protein